MSFLVILSVNGNSTSSFLLLFYGISSS